MPIIDMSDIQEAVVIDDPTSNLPDTTHFITANTSPITLSQLRTENTIPVFAKDNALTISHQDFCQAVYEAARDFFHGEIVDEPAIRVSHEVKGRIASAIYKPLAELLDTDKTIYWQRCAFVVKISSIQREIDGNTMSLCIAGTRSYHLDRLTGRLCPQHFKLGIGFLVSVCTNLCLTTDGLKHEILATSPQDLYRAALSLIQSYQMGQHLALLESLTNVSLTESQFAHILGRTRLYNFLPPSHKRGLPSVAIPDNAVNAIAKAYYTDPNFAANEGGEIPMWKFYNLLTGAIRNTYVDLFLEREAAATTLAAGISAGVQGSDSGYGWFLN